MTQTIWLCRRCATVFSAPPYAELYPWLGLRRRLSRPAKTERLMVHDCGHGGFGIADPVPVQAVSS